MQEQDIDSLSSSVMGDVDLAPIIHAINRKSGLSDEPAIAGYNKITGFLIDSNGESFDSVVLELQQHLEDIILTSCNDMVALYNPTLMQAALHAIGLCLSQEEVSRSLSDSSTIAVLCAVCKCINDAVDKAVCSRAMWFLSKQYCNEPVLATELDNILEAIENGQCCKKFQSVSVEYEALNAIIHLLQRLPTQMAELTVKWGKLVYPLAVHHISKIREQAFIAMEMGLPAMIEHQNELAVQLVPDLKSLLISELTKLLMNKQEEIYALKVWRCYVQILGKVLHHGALINLLLPVVEKGFKVVSPDVKCASYECWETLIDNFSLNPDILSDSKRIRLLLQVFRIVSAGRVESVAVAKTKVWWHLVVKLGNHNAHYFDQVCGALIQYCAHGTTDNTPHKSPAVSRIGRAGSKSPGTPGGSTVHPAVQNLGAEILVHTLRRNAHSLVSSQYTFTLPCLEEVLIPSVVFFMKHSEVFIPAVTQSIKDLGNTMDAFLLTEMWDSLTGWMKQCLDTADKKEAGEVLRQTLESLQELVTSQCLETSALLGLFEPFLALPSKVLSSSTYHVGGTSTTQVMQGCPALFLLSALTHHRIVETSVATKTFQQTFTQLLHHGVPDGPPAAILEFCQTVLESLQQMARGQGGETEVQEALTTMWTNVAALLQQNIVTSQEVNQGNTLEHDFSCLLSALSFPVLHLLPYSPAQASLKSLIKTWTDLYSSFSRAAALVANADANAACEEFCAKLLNHNVPTAHNGKGDVVYLDALLQMCRCVVNSVDFSTFSNNFGMSAASPGKLYQKKLRPLGNLHSLVELCRALTEAIQEASEKAEKASSVQSCGLLLCGLLETLFTHVPSSALLAALLDSLIPSVASILSAASSRGGNKMYSQQLLTKLEQLFTAIVTSVQSQYSGQFDSELLVVLAPLLQATFLHSRRAIKNQALSLWNATFAAHRQPLVYPEELIQTLTTVKNKTNIHLPGWNLDRQAPQPVSSDASQYTQGESQISIPNITGLKSPVKNVGSFLHKAASPAPKSPRVTVDPSLSQKSPATPGTTRKKLDLQDLKDKDFVIFTPSKEKKKRVLTEHQKEVMREQRREGTGISGLYSAVEISQDVSMMAGGGTLDTQLTLDSPDVNTPVMEITPFPFSSVRKPSNEPAVSKALQNKEDVRVAGIKAAQEKENSDQSEDTNSDTTTRTTKKGRRRKSVRFNTDAEAAKTVDGTPSKQTDNDNNDKNSGPRIVQISSAESDDVVVLETQSLMANSSKFSPAQDSVIVISDTQKTDSENKSGEEDGKAGRLITDSETQDTSDKKLAAAATSENAVEAVCISPSQEGDSETSKQSSGSAKQNGRNTKSTDTPTTTSSSRYSGRKTRSADPKSKAPKSPTRAHIESPQRKKLNFANAFSGESSSLPDVNHNKRSLLFGTDTQSPPAEPTSKMSSSAPVIHFVMAEESQHMSPGKFRKLSGGNALDTKSTGVEKGSDVVEETPVKESMDSVVVSREQAEQATKALFSGSLDLDIVPDTEMDPHLEQIQIKHKEDPDLDAIPESQSEPETDSKHDHPSVKAESELLFPNTDEVDEAMEYEDEEDKVHPENDQKLSGHETSGQTTTTTSQESQVTVIHNAQKQQRPRYNKLQAETTPEDSITISQLVSAEPTDEGNTNNTNNHTSTDNDSLSQLDKEIEPMEFSSQEADNSQATLVTKPKRGRRRSKPPGWMKDMESPSRNVSSPRSQSTPLASITSPKTRQGKAQRLSQQSKNSSPASSIQSISSKEEDLSQVLAKGMEEGTMTENSEDCKIISKPAGRRSLSLVRKQKEINASTSNGINGSAVQNGIVDAEQKLEESENSTPSSQNSRKGRRKRKSRSNVDDTEQDSEVKSSNTTQEDLSNSQNDSVSQPCKRRRITKKSQSSQELKKSDSFTSDPEDNLPLNMLGTRAKDSLDLSAISMGKDLEEESSEDEDIPLKNLKKSSQSGLSQEVHSSIVNNDDDECEDKDVTTEESGKKESQENTDVKDNGVDDDDDEISCTPSNTSRSVSVIKRSSAGKSNSVKKLTSSQKLLTINMKTSPSLSKRLRSKGTPKERSARRLSRSFDRNRSFEKATKARRKRKRGASTDSENGNEDSICTEGVDESPIPDFSPIKSNGKTSDSPSPSKDSASNQADDSPTNETENTEFTAVKEIVHDKANESIELIESNENGGYDYEDNEVLSPMKGNEQIANSDKWNDSEIRNSDLEDTGVEADLEIDGETKESEVMKSNDTNQSFEPILSPSKTKPISLPSPLKKEKGSPFMLPETPTSTTAKKTVMSRADLILQRSRLLLNNKNGPSPSTSSSFASKMFMSPPARPTAIMAAPPSGGILKKSPQNVSPVKGVNEDDGAVAGPSSPSRMGASATFRPINVPRIYSPSASPSAGILKKRQRLSEGATPTADTPSPPQAGKKRRVSFASSNQVRTIASRKARPNSPLPVNRCLDMPRPQAQSPLVSPATGGARASASNGKPKKLDVSQTQDTCQSTQESQLDTTGPVFPALIDCQVPVEQLLPQLTTSMWMRGLGQLIRAKNIRTVGDLSRLSEYDVSHLPIRSPKVATVKQVLEAFANKLKPAEDSSKTREIETTTESHQVSESASSSDEDMVREDIRQQDFLDQIQPLENKAQDTEDDKEKDATEEKIDGTTEGKMEDTAEDKIQNAAEEKVEDTTENKLDESAAEDKINDAEQDEEDEIEEMEVSMETEVNQEEAQVEEKENEKEGNEIEESNVNETPTENNPEEQEITGSKGKEQDRIESQQDIFATEETEKSQEENSKEKTETATATASNVEAQVLEPTKDNSNATTSSPASHKEARKLVTKTINSLNDQMTAEVLSHMPSHQLLQIHQQLNGMMGAVVVALQEKCPIGSPSQSTQE